MRTTSVVASLQDKLGRSRKQTGKQRSGLSVVRTATYSGMFIVVVATILLGYDRPESVDATPSLASVGSFSSADDGTAPTVDAIVASDVAADFTEHANLPIATIVANKSVSLDAQSELAQTDDSVITKPQIVQADNSGRTIQIYKVKRGDTVPELAAKFNVSESTIRWANNLIGDALEPNRKLKILPVNGVVHTVKNGETTRSIANKYRTSEARITLFNDLDLAKPQRGQQLIIPDGVLPNTQRPGYEAPQQSFAGGGSGGVAISSNVALTAGNRYAFGNCTWYVYERRVQLGRPVGSFWGNANTWAYSASAAGYTVSSVPRAGAVIQTSGGGGGYGHVGLVERVDAQGNVHITEMNYVGFNVVNSRTIPAGQASGYSYIY